MDEIVKLKRELAVEKEVNAAYENGIDEMFRKIQHNISCRGNGHEGLGKIARKMNARIEAIRNEYKGVIGWKVLENLLDISDDCSYGTAKMDVYDPCIKALRKKNWVELKQVFETQGEMFEVSKEDESEYERYKKVIQNDVKQMIWKEDKELWKILFGDEVYKCPYEAKMFDDIDKDMTKLVTTAEGYVSRFSPLNVNTDYQEK